MEDNTYKHENNDTNSSKNFESETLEDPKPTVDDKKTNQFFPPGKIQIAHDPENKILAHFVGESGDHLPCASEDSSRLDTQTNETVSSTLEKEIDTLESCSQKYSTNLLMSFENSLEVDKSINKQDVRKAKENLLLQMAAWKIILELLETFLSKKCLSLKLM
ncbi:hypothetical protein CEXT_573181 [Caerostris extrusa]|uniref:Uncharacterized protein n=1 Tax=Caerostris extrusa TaxID=172846 RepID=A0AAV4VN69_CAEEX|nr:hypothetical protein CEXT_573181 [Caerostris extrusa]